jgi:hypothetical protein
MYRQTWHSLKSFFFLTLNKFLGNFWEIFVIPESWAWWVEHLVGNVWHCNVIRVVSISDCVLDLNGSSLSLYHSRM